MGASILAAFATRRYGPRSHPPRRVRALVPAVPGYRLVAVRADVVAGHDARVLVYEQGSERITLCIWPAGREAAHPARQAVYRGMAIRYWNDGSAEFWAASPEPGEGLAAFVATLMRHPV